MEQRKSKRFEIKLPLKIVRSGIRSIAAAGETRNLSSGGVLFSTDMKIDVGEPVEYVITLSQGTDSKPVTLHCLGKVMRLDTSLPAWEESNRLFQVAATLERYEFVRNGQ